MRKIALANGSCYHIFNRSIAGFKIFNNNLDFQRFIESIKYYRFCDSPINFAELKRLSVELQLELMNSRKQNDCLVDIVCYCVMPTHFHMLLRQNIDHGITKFLGLIENSCSRYFNVRHKRKGPLWEGRFKNVRIETDEQLLHLTRYIHLNPTSANLVRKPENWKYSSYNEYLKRKEADNVCEFGDIIDIQPKEYQKFVNNQKDYQQQLLVIKSQTIDYYAG